MEPSDTDRILFQLLALSRQIQELETRLQVRLSSAYGHMDTLAQQLTLSTSRSQVHEEILHQLAASIGRMDQYAARQDALNERLAAMLARHETRLDQHDSHMARLGAILQAIRDLLDRGNGH